MPKDLASVVEFHKHTDVFAQLFQIFGRVGNRDEVYDLPRVVLPPSTPSLPSTFRANRLKRSAAETTVTAVEPLG